MPTEPSAIRHVQNCDCHGSDPTINYMGVNDEVLWHESHRHPYVDPDCAYLTRREADGR